MTVWAKEGGGRWMAVLDASLEPATGRPSTRKVVRTVTSRDGTLEASIGTWERGEGAGRASGTFLVVRERQGGAWRTVVESELASPPGK